MPAVHACDLPTNALLSVYARMEGCYTDCYSAELAMDIDLPDYIDAFYTTPLFKLERLILKLTVARPSTDDEALLLARARIDQFAAWRVEDRTGEQLLMCDMSGRTRSWLMVDTVVSSTRPTTRLYFGSAVVPVVSTRSGNKTLGYGFSALLGFHKLYSRALLSAAKSRLEK